MLLKAHGKINWTLDILGQREDGYHWMDMLMQPVTLTDKVRLTPAESLTLTTGGWPLLQPGDRHLALRAARALQERTGCSKGAAIHVEKHIPVGAGMGGGSADAAAVLFGLNRLWETGLSQEELESVGLALGADVPFCLRGGLVRTTGIGETMRPVVCGRCYDLVIVQPCRGLSTGAVFKAYHAQPNSPRPRTESAELALSNGNAELLAASLGNVLQDVSQAMRPPIGQAIAELKRSGAINALMTGSGSAVFGIYTDAARAAEAAKALRHTWRSTYLCKTCEESLTIIS